MEKRQFGRSGHMSSVAIFGGAALHPTITQDEADAALDMALAAGVNHYDTAASYGNGMAETRMGPWVEKHRSEIFLGTKTGERGYGAAWAEINRSVALLRGPVDLIQIHAVTTFEELDKATGPDGALEAAQRARDEGLTTYVGITGHGWLAPAIYREALNRFDFDSVLFPINGVLFGKAEYRDNAEKLLQTAQERNVGIMAIKSIAKGPWHEGQDRTYKTWYEPHDVQDTIQQCVNFTLSQAGVTGIPIAGDTRLLPMVLKAAENFQPMSQSEQNAWIENCRDMEAIFA
ncbi:MAG: aldo/keto reductase [Anaerolineaceae bacterium]|nr:aldo/keto reductase [Anaerolineaceae bacterium]